MKSWWLQRTGLGMGFLNHPTLASVATWPERRSAVRAIHELWSWSTARDQRRTLTLTVLGVVLGVFIVAQWQTPLASPATDSTSRDVAIHGTIDRLETEQSQLKKQIADLRARTSAEQQQISRGKSASDNLGKALATQRMLAGTVPVQGKGIDILLDDSNSQQLLPSDDPDNYIVHEYQIRDIVNLLWGAGASAISVNGERFVNSTSVYCVGSTILINDTRTSPPYHILAVGDESSLEQALDDGNSLRDLKARAQVYGVVLKVVNAGMVTVPAYDGSFDLKHTAIAASTER
ncbi:MAG: DUF881 domain-containing protein [Chloroflexota bacterium]